MLKTLIPGLFALLLVACGSPEQKDTDSSETAQDSMPIAEEKLAPNSVQVQARVVDQQQGESGKLHLRLQILSIEGYGSSTRPLGRRDTLNAAVSSEFLEKEGITLTSGSDYRLILSQTVIKMGNQPQSGWSVIDFK